MINGLMLKIKTQEMKQTIRIVSITIVAFTGLLFLMSVGQFPEWTVPEEQAAVENPVANTPAAVNNGRALYDLQCKSCHGTRGLGDGLIPSASLISDEFQAQTDGAIFWKLIEGRGQMPSFAALPAEQLWEVIHFLRSFAIPVVVVAKKKTMIELMLVEKDSVRKVVAKAYEITDDGSKVPVENVRLILGVKRMFGILPLTTGAAYTNSKGIVSGVFPPDLPGDTAGNVIITAYIDDPAYEEAAIEKHTDWGKAWQYTDITKQRSLWAQMKYAPIWLLVSFTAVAGAIWLTILFVMLELKKINDKGRKFSKSAAESQA